MTRPVKHGTYSGYVVDKCRCTDCREANRVAAANRRRLQLYGRWDRLVDAQPVRDHLAALSAAGMGWKRVGAAAGVANGTIYPILYGKHLDDPTHPDHRPPRRRVTKEVAEKLLAVELDIADRALQPALGTARRIRALNRVGWSNLAIARHAGIDPQRLYNLTDTGQVTAETVRIIRATYDDLWNTPPTSPAGVVRRVINHATRQGWPPPMAWDDDLIDNPDHTPDLGVDRRATIAELAHDLADLGLTFDQIRRNLNVSIPTLTTSLKRDDPQLLHHLTGRDAA